jgi:hypothetical protein
MDQYFENAKTDNFRLTASYVPQVDMETFGCDAKELSFTDPGVKK